MVGIWGSHSSSFLQILALGMLLVFALPILLVPFRWARAFQWDLPEDSDLALYFGRCLGGIACVLGAVTLYVAAEPALQPFFMRMLLGVYLILTLVHVVGAVQGVQPVSETVEIGFWLALIVLTLCFLPAGSVTLQSSLAHGLQLAS